MTITDDLLGDDPWEHIRWARTFLEKLGHSRPSVVDRDLRDEACKILAHYPHDEWIDEQRGELDE